MIALNMREGGSFENTRRLRRNNERVCHTAIRGDTASSNHLSYALLALCVRWITQWTAADELTFHLLFASIYTHKANIHR